MADMDGFEGEIVLDPPVNAGGPEGLAPLTVKFVRYEGCQQLILWLPQDGYAGYAALRIHAVGGVLIEEAEVTARLNGRVQILIDTFPWRPGRYRIEITHKDGWRHEVQLEKLEEGIVPAPASPPVIETRSGPIVYRNGAGNILPDLDLELREQASARLVARFGRRLEFEGSYRAGIIVYVEGDMRIRFPHEMCGGGVHFSIDIPVPASWEAATGRPLAEREDIITFLAEETRRRQASSWSYVIHEDRIDFVD